MEGTHSTGAARHSDRVAAVLVLTAIACGCACVMGPCAGYWRGVTGIQQAIMANATCWVTGLAALELCRTGQPSNTIFGLALMGILVRMMLPLAICGASALWLGVRPTQCLAICFILVYPIFLAADMFFVVRLLGRSKA